MQATLVDSIRPGDWIFEIKFDGYRAIALRGGTETRVLSRNQKDLGKKFPEIVSSIAAIDVQDVIIDGEIVALDDKGRSSFQALQGFDMGTERPPIVYYAFDLLWSSSGLGRFERPASAGFHGRDLQLNAPEHLRDLRTNAHQ